MSLVNRETGETALEDRQCVKSIVFKAHDVIIAAGYITSGMSNETAQSVLRWIIMIILAIVTIAATVFIVWQIIRFIRFLYYRSEDFFGYPFIAFKLTLLSLCVHLGKYQVIVEDEFHINVWAAYAVISAAV